MGINTSVGKLKLATPLILASGYITETPEFFLRARLYGCSALVTRSLKDVVPLERRSTPSPRYVVLGDDSMLNCEWSNENDWTIWRDEWVDRVKIDGSPIIVSLSGRDVDSCSKLILAFSEKAVDAFEINVSCSHSGALHGNLNVDFAHISSLLQKVRPLTRIPIWIKLSYSPVVVSAAQLAENSGADAIVCTNTIGPGMLIDVNSTRPKLGVRGGAGGLSGRAIFPIALRCVYEISQAVNIPVVGVGGISDSTDAIQMLLAGASAVQLYTAPVLHGPIVFQRIIDGLTDYLSQHEVFQSVSDLIGYSHKWADHQSFFVATPTIVQDRCSGCGRCNIRCAFGGIVMATDTLGKKKVTITNRCIGCNACVGACPSSPQAIEVVYGQGRMT